MTDLRTAAETAIHQCLDLGAEESIAIVTDDERRPIAEALYEVAAEITPDAAFVQYPPGEQHGEEPPEPVAAAMKGADAFLAPTTRSLSHTRARSAACEAGARGATLPGITERVMVAGLDADYEAIAQHCQDVLAQVEDADEIRVTSPAGTDITFAVGDREWHDDTGMVREPGTFSNLPAGEVFVSSDIGASSLTDDGIEVEDADTDSDEIPTSYVPFRNANLLSMAVSYAEANGCSAVFVGAHSEDYAGYPDCRPEFFEAFEAMVDVGTKPETDIAVEVPFVTDSKTDIARRGRELGVPFEHTWSCYRDEEPACGTCDSCAYRLQAFRNVGARDPIEYAERPEHAE